MTGRSCRLCVLLALLGASGFLDPVGAIAASNPRLFAEIDGVDDDETRRELRLAHLRMEVAIDGSVAETTLTAHFLGVPDDVVEGHFSLTLPPGAVVNGYALDVDGEMIEGALVARPKARHVYESKVRRTIDPGVGELVNTNVFSTRVYPIEDEAGRKIRVRFAMPVHRGFVLPLETDAAIDSVDIEVTARNIAHAPSVEFPVGLAVTSERSRDRYIVSASARNAKLSGQLAVAPTLPKREVLVSANARGERFFQIRSKLLPETQPRTPLQRIRVYWDASLSRRDDRLAEEIDILERYVRAIGGVPIDLVTFNSAGARLDEFGSVSQLRAALEGLEYRGGTSFAMLNGIRPLDAQICLLFSDGRATIDRRDTFDPECVLKAIASAPDADFGYLAHLTRTSGGVVVRADLESIDSAVQRLLRDPPVIVAARGTDGRPLAFSVVENGPEGFFILGAAPRTDSIALEFKTSIRGRTVERRYEAPKRRATRFDGVGSLWAAEQIAALNAREADLEEIERISRRYSVASSDLAWVVLETPEDYAEAGVTPPKNYPPDALKAYAEARAEREEELAEERALHSRRVRAEWAELKAWWATEFDPKARPLRRPPPRQNVDERRRFGVAPGVDRGNLQEIIVTAQLVCSDAQGSPVAIEPWRSDRPYIRALETAGTNFRDVLAAQQTEYGDLPAFYLDTAEWLFQRGAIDEASEMLLSSLELPLANDETRSIVADRLLRYGYIERAIWLYEQIVRVESHRPQPLMQLANALAKRAELRPGSAKRDLQRAIALLNKVATTPWDDEYDGVALVALMDANALVARLQRMGGGRVALAPGLIALLDLDLRVVIQWNTAATDIDLWVDEPNGERAIYNYPRTLIGGRLSNDMTAGYGPEEYLLRRAAPGRYRVFIHAYAHDALNPNGATTVTARFIYGFGRPNEHEELVDVELMPAESGEKLVGTIFVGGTE